MWTGLFIDLFFESIVCWAVCCVSTEEKQAVLCRAWESHAACFSAVIQRLLLYCSVSLVGWAFLSCSFIITRTLSSLFRFFFPFYPFVLPINFNTTDIVYISLCVLRTTNYLRFFSHPQNQFFLLGGKYIIFLRICVFCLKRETFKGKLKLRH